MNGEVAGNDNSLFRYFDAANASPAVDSKAQMPQESDAPHEIERYLAPASH